MAIQAKAEADLRTLMNIPSNYKASCGRRRRACPPHTPSRDARPSLSLAQVLFLQGGATTQFAAIPLNLTQEGDVADFVITGSWVRTRALPPPGYRCRSGSLRVASGPRSLRRGRRRRRSRRSWAAR